MSSLSRSRQGLHIKGTHLWWKGLQIQSHHAHQHKGRTHQQVNGQLHTSIFLANPLGGAPNNNHDINRNNHNLIAQQEDKQIPGNKGTSYTSNENHQENIELLGALRNTPGAKHSCQAYQIGQKQHRQGNTIYSQSIMYP